MAAYKMFPSVFNLILKIVEQVVLSQLQALMDNADYVVPFQCTVRPNFEKKTAAG